MKVLISGGAGFIGSHLADQLLARGDQVLVIDNYRTGRRENLAPQPGLTVIEGTIADAQLVDEAFTRFGPQLIVHAAASYKDPHNWEEDARTNVVGTAIVVQAAQRHGVRRLIYFQTALCYGLRPLQQPIRLDHPLDPAGSSYAVSKTAGEYYVRQSDLDYISFRLANVYGPRNLSGPLPTFYDRLTRSMPLFVSDARRDFLYVDDLLAVVLKAIDGQGGSGVYHVSTGKDLAIIQLYEALAEALNVAGAREADVTVRPRAPGDAAAILLDPSLTTDTFGWRASTPFELGVGAAVAYYEKFGVPRTYSHLGSKQ